MAHHTNYWTCSSFADWLRGTPKPGAETSEGWSAWTKKAKAAYPIRYWLADEGLGYLQDFVTYPIRKIYDFKYYINNRFVTRSHSLTAHAKDIKPGNWCDVGNRFLPCLFNELVNFVEVEQAWSHIAWGDKETRAKYETPFWASGWFRWRTWRCPQAGLDHLDWAMTLTNVDWCDKDHKDYGKPTSQAITAKEIKELYIWWTETYRNRPEPMDVSGWSAHCEAMRLKHPDSMFASLNTKDSADRKASDKAHKLLQKIEAAYDKEETEMLIRLIKVRESLWT